MDATLDLKSQVTDPVRGEGSKRSYPRVPIQAAAALSVILLVAIAVAALSWQAYRSSQDALVSASNEAVGYIRDAVGEKTRRIIEPAEAQLNFLSHSALAAATSLPDRLRLVPLMAAGLHSNAILDAIYYGYANGEFILFRPLMDSAERGRLNAPANAAMVVQSVSLQEGGSTSGEYRFYDDRNNLVEVRPQPSYQFDPRTRGWYQASINQSDAVLTDPYVFYTTGLIGITLAQRTVDGGAVAGIDLKLRSIAEQIEKLKITPSAEVALVNRKQQVVAYSDAERMVIREPDGNLRLATVGELKSAPLLAAYGLMADNSGQVRGSTQAYGRTWQTVQAGFDVTQSRRVKLLIAIPNDEFFSAARDMLWRQLQVAALILSLAILAAWWLTKAIAAPLRRLAGEAARIEQFDFESGGRIRSMLREVDDLARALHRMKRTIRKFLNIGDALAAERDFRSLLDRVLRETIDIVESDGGAIFMLDDAQTGIVPETIRWVRNRSESATRTVLQLDRGGIFDSFTTAIRSREMVVTQQHPDEQEIALLGLEETVKRNSGALVLAIMPLLDRNQAPFALLVLNKAANAPDEAWTIDDRLSRLIHAVSGSASVAIQNKILLDAQRKLIDSLIKLVAGAIDAKSAYTGGHCQRVPALTRLLAQAAVDQREGPLGEFSMTEEEWEALDIAAWLHDCGKVTTPEYVVDKATKLETIYDRIHEIRMRFELLKSEAETAYWRGRAEGKDEASLQKTLEEEKRALDDDFAFIAMCNEGGEFLDPAMIDRIKNIATRRWTRTISNRLGASYEERRRFDREPEPDLPVREQLLSDRYDHVVTLEERDVIAADNPWGFALTVPKLKFNRGEIYNLCISRGTLTEEERYRINDHIVQTIIMLEGLPFPKHLRAVPELAGGHHEKMDGTGYPRRRRREDMSVVARIMAIADVFEALTAADRPYKKAKKLSEAVKIMGFMKKDNHLDPDLLDLFLESGVWREYARTFLDPDQIDEPDIGAVIATKPAPPRPASRN